MSEQLIVRVRDGVFGRPAAGVPVRVEVDTESGWQTTARGATAEDGGWLGPPQSRLRTGPYRVVLDSGAYFAGLGIHARVGELSIGFPPAAHAGTPCLDAVLVPCGSAAYVAD
ncbi:hydroxyisourate hydrolase [Micromonosporaceae bacterium B7E4]